MRTKPHAATIGRALVAVTLLLYGLLTVFVAIAWGPGNSDQAVSGGLALVPWFGLPCLGTAAACVSVAGAARPRVAWTAAWLAGLSLIAWTLWMLTYSK